MLIIGIILVISSLFLLFFLIKKIVNNDYTDDLKFRKITNGFAIIFVLLGCGLALIMQHYYGAAPWLSFAI